MKRKGCDNFMTGKTNLLNTYSINISYQDIPSSESFIGHV